MAAGSDEKALRAERGSRKARRLAIELLPEPDLARIRRETQEIPAA